MPRFRTSLSGQPTFLSHSCTVVRGLSGTGVLAAAETILVVPRSSTVSVETAAAYLQNGAASMSDQF